MSLSTIRGLPTCDKRELVLSRLWFSLF